MLENKINKNFLLLLTIYAFISFVIISSVFVHSQNNFNKEVSKLNAEISTASQIGFNNVVKWVSEKAKSVNAISENLSVVMYLTEIKKGLDIDERLAQEQFIKNYLISESRKSGLSDNQTQIKANVNVDSAAALAIFDLNGKIIISQGLQKNISEIIRKVKDPSKKSDFFDIIFSDNGKTGYFVFINPIKKLQEESNLGYIVGVKKIDEEIIELLDIPSSNKNISNVELVKKEKNDMVSLNKKNYIKFENIPETSSIEITTGREPNKIISGYNRNAEKVAAIAKNIKGNLFLIYSVNELKALKDAKIYSKTIISITILALVAVGLLMLLVWRHSASVKFERVNNELKEQRDLLKLVTDNQLQSMLLLEGNKVSFVNKPFLTKNRMKYEEAINKPIANVVGYNEAKEYKNLSAIDPINPVAVTKKYEENDKISYIQKKSIPVRTDNEEGYLYVENDITQLMKEREKYENNLSNVIETLIRIIEKRSSYFHNHTRKTTELGVAVAESLNVDEKIRRAVEISAKLCNLYLALLPRELINKQDSLSNEEKKLFDESPSKTIDLIKDLEFDAPVVDTLVQMMERPDGTGPLQLHDNKIIESAKILRTVNDFVAMTSERPYRRKISTSEAIDILLKQKDTKYSKRVVFALANIVEKKEAA